MSDLIHANELLKKVISLQSLDGMEIVSKHNILIAKTVDAVEVVPAEWKFDHMTGETAHYADCSICGVHKFFKDVSEYSNFCPNCGADMRGAT